MELRTYQLEVLAKIREFKSTVAFMPTGSGKTLVAVWLLRERIALQQRDVADGQAKKVCVFSAPNKVLCHQQADYIGSNIGDDQRCRIRVLTGETPRIDNWCGTEWKDILASVEVIVCVPEILRRALACNFVDSNLIDTLIFDECHHCVSKKGVSSGHPYCQLAQLARGARKYVGLTASPINCKKVDVKKNMQQLKTVLSLNGECEIVRPSATLAELQEYVHTPEPQLELYASPVYRPNCDRFDDCKAKGQRLHDLMCGAYKRVSWLDEYCAIRKSLRHVDANYTAVVGLVSANLMDLPHNEVSYYCELLGQLGKVLHEGGSRAALHALKYICRTHDEILEDYALPELYNQAEGKIEPGRLKFRIKRLEEHVAEFPLWPGTMANAVRQSLWEACEAICVYGGLELVEVAGNIDIPGVSLEDLKRYITETFVPRLLGMAVDADKLLKLRSVLQLDDLAHSKYSATIVFVGERLMARALAATLNLRYCVGGNGERVSKQTEALEWFKDTAEEGSQRAVLIATSVCDEGVDVPICDCVVMWDVPPNVRSFIQRRGRARKIRPTKSELIVLVEASNFAVTKANESLREYQRQEAQMATLADCWEDGIDSADDDSDSEIQPRVVIGREGVRISCRHAKGTLHEFASSLTATDEFFTPTPIFFGEKRDESFRATVILPSSVRPPIARWAMSRWHATKGRAIREASARQLEKLAVLPWVTPQFKNMYAVGKADGVNEDLLPPGDLLDLAAHQLTERRGDVAPALVKPTDDNSVMYAYQLRVQWHNAGMEIPERLGNWRELTRKRVAAIEKLRILTPEQSLLLLRWWSL